MTTSERRRQWEEYRNNVLNEEELARRVEDLSGIITDARDYLVKRRGPAKESWPVWKDERTPHELLRIARECLSRIEYLPAFPYALPYIESRSFQKLIMIEDNIKLHMHNCMSIAERAEKQGIFGQSTGGFETELRRIESLRNSIEANLSQRWSSEHHGSLQIFASSRLSLIVKNFLKGSVGDFLLTFDYLIAAVIMCAEYESRELAKDTEDFIRSEVAKLKTGQTNKAANLEELALPPLETAADIITAIQVVDSELNRARAKLLPKLCLLLEGMQRVGTLGSTEANGAVVDKINEYANVCKIRFLFTDELKGFRDHAVSLALLDRSGYRSGVFRLRTSGTTNLVYSNVKFPGLTVVPQPESPVTAQSGI